MKTSIILIAYNGDRWLPACVESLGKASSSRLHLVLVDNAGNSLIDRLDLSAFDAEVLSTPQPMGFAEANNYALVNAARLEKTVLFLNQDTISTRGWIDTCMGCLQADDSLGAVSPLITTYDGSGWDPSFLDCVGSEEDLNLELKTGTGGCFITRNAPAPALIVRTGVIAATGPFDPIFGSYYEDYDLCSRIREAGFRIGFARGARIAHYSGSATDTRKKELRRMRTIIRNRLIHRLRIADESRASILIKHVFMDTPRRLARGLIGTESSQPVRVTVGANVDLAKIGWRLASPKRDRAAWEAYLERLRWRERMTEIELNHRESTG
ncbi:MAG: glycosyltransferase [Rhodothermales bacterium]|nr:glycosyltransferase [Rhodothermales bacterium]